MSASGQEERPYRLSIAGMACAGCVQAVEQALRAVTGVTEATVNFAEHTANVSGDVPLDDLVQAVKDAGYGAAELRGVEDEAEKEAAEFGHYRSLLAKAALAGAVGAPLMLGDLLGRQPRTARVVRDGSREARTRGLDLLNGRAAALRKMRTPKCSPEIDPWRTLRIQQIDRGEVGLRIGHLDLLGLPC